MKIDLILPVRDVLINQPFGVNYLDFYKQWGLKGHPGIDFSARRGCKIKAAHKGVVSWCGKGKDGGIGVEIWNRIENYKTFYYHHLKNSPKLQNGVAVGQGEIIAEADNTGKYTTGSHEHFEFYFTGKNGNTIDTKNGFKGSVDPAPYFAASLGKDWDKPAAYHRYGRKQVWLAEFNMRFKNIWLHRQLKKRGLLHYVNITEFINKLCYGFWSFEDAINPAMNEITNNLTKIQYQKGERPFA